MKRLNYLIIAVGLSVTWAALASYIYWDGLSNHSYSFVTYFNLHKYFKWQDQFGNDCGIDRVIKSKRPKIRIASGGLKKEYQITKKISKDLELNGGDVVGFNNEVLRPVFSVWGFLKLTFFPIFMGWLLIMGLYIVLRRRNWFIEIFRRNYPFAVGLLIAFVILSAYLNVPFDLCILITLGPIVSWFIIKKVIYDLIFTVVKAVQDAKGCR